MINFACFVVAFCLLTLPLASSMRGKKHNLQ